MRLPGNIQAGDTIKLEVISLLPRITFGMIASTNPLSTPSKSLDRANAFQPCGATNRKAGCSATRQQGSLGGGARGAGYQGAGRGAA